MIWLGIVFCLIQSGLFSGLNLALLGLSRRQLEVESKAGNEAADRILSLREDSNFLLTRPGLLPIAHVWPTCAPLRLHTGPLGPQGKGRKICSDRVSLLG